MRRIEKVTLPSIDTVDRRMQVQGMLLYLPALLVIFLVVAYPLVYALRMSVTNYSPTRKIVSIVGLLNYTNILSNLSFWKAMGRSLFFTIACLTSQICLGLAMASLLNSPRLKCKMLFRGFAITPWLIPTVTVAMIFKWMFNDLYGILNFLMMNLHLISEPKAWMSKGSTAMLVLILANIWRGTPLMITMFLAAMQGIPKEYYEAARVDGANRLQVFGKITFPLLLPVIMVSGVLRFIWIFNYYDLPWIMTGGGPDGATQTTSVYAYRMAFSSYHLGEGSAISIILFIVLILFAVIYFKMKKLQDKIYK